MSEFLNILKTLFLVVFFGNPVTLTPSPIDMGEGSHLVFNLEKPVRVIGGAYISIDVTSMQPTHVDGLISTREWVDEAFGKQHISATLVNTLTDEEVKLERYGLSYNSTASNIKISKNGGLERGKTYDRIIIKTDVELNHVTMRWSSWSL
ncbi:hypothetical protein [Vreelandella sp. GE22]